MKKMMWDARFSKAADSRLNDFNSSIPFDCRMFRQDIRGSIAHATMLGRCGIIEQSESDKIVAELKNISADIESGKLPIDYDAEDIHMFVETVLTERLGETGKRLHTARSRNDQVALDIRMYMMDELCEVRRLVTGLLSVIYDKAADNKQTIMPGYTHMQHAQPVTFAHHLLAYAQMFMRDARRLDEVYAHTDVMPLGSGALASTTYPIDRELTASLLGFSAITENSLDGVSDRDFVIEAASVLSLIMMHLSRFSEEMIMWSTSEFSFIELDDAYSTGSSIMPQKKNPDIAELVRGKSGRVFGNLSALLTMMKGLPLAYNKDMQEDKEAIFDSIDNTKICLELFAKMLATATVKADKMRSSAQVGFMNATDLADYLTKRGTAFRDAYKISGRLVAYCVGENIRLEEVPLDKLREFSPLFDNSVYTAIAPVTCVNERRVIGGPSVQSVERQLLILRAFIDGSAEG